MPLPTEKNKLIRYLKANYIVTEKEGILYVAPERTYLESEVLEVKIVDTTPFVRKIRQEVIRNYVHRNIETFAVHGFMGGILQKACTMYKDPRIALDLLPVKTKSLVFHLFSFNITGDIVNHFYNHSTEGEEGTYSTWRWRPCSTNSDDYTWKKRAGSADLIPNWGHKFTEDTTAKVLAKVSQVASKVAPQQRSPDISASWKTGGLGDVIHTLLSIFLTGRVVLRNGYDATVKYTWKGQTQTVNRHINTKVALPVEGNIGVAFN